MTTTREDRDQQAATAVFIKATCQQNWTMTNLGATCKIDHEGYDYSVIVDLEFDNPASIPWRYGWGGTEHFGWNASSTMTTRLRTVATRALNR